MKAEWNSTNYLRAAIAVVLASGGTLGTGAAFAQQAAPASGTLDEVVVTATRRESNLQQTPIAVSAVDENLMQVAAPQTIMDIAQYVPNFSASKVVGFNAASFAMRGVGNTSIIVYNEAPVAVIVDDFVMPSVQSQILDAFDVQGIEVLRGPQGTLFGKNTTGGAVIVHTKQPLLDEFSFEGQVEGGSPGFTLRNVQGALNMPLIKDQLAMRVVVSREMVQGWMKNGASNTIFSPTLTDLNGTYTGDGSRKGGTDVQSARIKLLYQPSDNLRALFQYELVNDRSESPATINDTPSDSYGSPYPYFVFPALGLPRSVPEGADPIDYAGVSDRDGYLIDMTKGHRVDSEGFYLNVDWTVGPGTLSWVNGYRTQFSVLPSDYTGIVGPLSPFDANRSDNRYTWQEELRFASKSEGPFNYVVGGFYQHDETTFCVAQILGIYDLFGVPTPGNTLEAGYNFNPQVLCNGQEAKSGALFAEGTWNANDKLTVTLGARYTNEKKDWIGRRQVFVQNLGAPSTFDPNAGLVYDPNFTWHKLGRLMNAADFAKYPFGVVTDSKTWSEPTYRLILDYKFTPDMFGYFSFSHGFKAGGYNDQVGTTGNPITVDEKAPTNPEKADSFEVGFKGEFMDRRVRLNEALFYVKYKDAIRSVVASVTNSNGQPAEETLFRNAAGMTVYGIENEFTAKLTDELTLRIPASYQHCSYDSFHSDGATFDLTTLPVERCPEWTGTVALTWQQPLASGSQVIFDASANYESKNMAFASYSNPNDWARSYLDARTLLDATLTYRSADDKWFVRAIGRNLTDKRYRISAETVDPLWIFSFYGEPRYYGLEVGFKIAD